MSADKKSQFAAIEEEVLAGWKSHKVFESSVKNRQSQELFNFNDGPPFANGLPHFGHSLVTAIKDSMLRYKTMRGYYVPRRNGWDCHGLPVEFAIEKDFGISGKKQIEELGIDKFNAACRASIFKYKAEWEDFLTRYGRWSDYEHYYATVDTSYTESVWWTLSQINQKGLLYRGLKSVPYCPRCETPLSNFELNEGYKDDVPDLSVFALFPLRQEGQRASGSASRQAGPPVSLLAWTTTPWTLPANAALAVDPKADYAYVKLSEDGSTVILAKKRLEVLDLQKSDYKVLKTVKGKDLVGLRYKPLYELPKAKFTDDQAKNAHQVFADSAVSLDDGTGILHVAPRYGETDLNLGLNENLPLIESVDSSGHLVYGPKEALGKFFKNADEPIIADLTQQGKIFAAESNFKHTYPFCWRCDTPLMYFATTTWFVEVTKVKEQMQKTAEQINWVPGHIKTGRFGKWLEGARDWAISRNRYWGAPLPVWQNVNDKNDYIVIDSISQLEKLAGKATLEKALPKLEDGTYDLHRPFIDKIEFTKDGKTYKRVEEVLDCWFESGSMPIAQYHYPFENKDKAEELLTADFITEAIDQTRLWFYVQHVISTILFEKPAYKQVIVTGFIMAADGQKLSKRLKNYPPVEDVFDHEGADALRLSLLTSTQATETADYMRFNRDAVTDIQRNVLGTLFNSYKFFKTYAEVDKWQPPKSLISYIQGETLKSTSDNLLDQWILARLGEATAAVTKSADAYKIAHAIEPVVLLIDDLSNWYIRRSRRRFWKSENDTDKEQAYSTLYYTLMRTCQLLAPWAPFLTDHIWYDLAQKTDLPKSVHLSDWPFFAKASEVPLVGRSLGGSPSVKEQDSTSQKLLDEMETVRQAVAEGLAQRAQAKIKVRQPLQAVVISLDIGDESVYDDPARETFAGIIAEELNVKEVTWLQDGRPVEVITEITPELKSEGVMRELVRVIQNARKNANLRVDDRIQLKIESDSSEITGAAKKFKATIYAETLATGELTGEPQHSESVKVEGQEVKISLSKPGV